MRRGGKEMESVICGERKDGKFKGKNYEIMLKHGNISTYK